MKKENDGVRSASKKGTLGQKVDTFVSDGSQLVIPTDKYQDGIYFIKTSNGNTQRLVITHE